MMQVIEQTRNEKLAMYMKLTRRELAEMLVNANDALQSLAMSQLCPVHVIPAGGVTWVGDNNIVKGAQGL